VKFPAIASSSIQYLKEFLINPSPILSRLYEKQGSSNLSKFFLLYVYTHFVFSIK